MSQEQRRLHAIVHGRVQGVNYRYHTMQEAVKRSIFGWVRNLPNGTVEVIAEGTRPQLEELLGFLHQGSPSAVVTQVDAEWLTANGEFIEFEIR